VILHFKRYKYHNERMSGLQCNAA